MIADFEDELAWTNNHYEIRIEDLQEQLYRANVSINLSKFRRNKLVHQLRTPNQKNCI